MKLAACFLAAVSALAQQPRITNGRLETRPVSSGLYATVRALLGTQASPLWIGYAEPIIPGDRQDCCWNSGGGCFLEKHSRDQTITAAGPQTVKLEGPTHVMVLYRVENHQIGKIRAFTPECDLDAGGLPLIWLTGVAAPESVRFLASVAKSDSGATRDEARIADSAVWAIALHADSTAEQALEELVAPSQPEKLRRQAIFGLAERNDPQALGIMQRVAHNDTSPRVRGQALFWLAQKAGHKVAESAIGDAIANDPETEVKKKAVFALTQIPNGEGVPLLIQLARTNRNPEVRKQAVFWLGQSKDSRALAFIDDVLK